MQDFREFSGPGFQQAVRHVLHDEQFLAWSRDLVEVLPGYQPVGLVILVPVDVVVRDLIFSASQQGEFTEFIRLDEFVVDGQVSPGMTRSIMRPDRR